MEGKTILITGTSQGIGNALARTLHSLGATVIAQARRQECLKELEKDCPGITTICVDLKDWEATKNAFLGVPILDGLVNNAGVAIIKPFEELTEADFDETFNVNIKAVFNVTQTVSPRMKAGSSIVNISSLASQRAFVGHSVYSATKAAVDSLTKSFALEFGSRRIRVNSINPTVILTKMGRENWSEPAKANSLLSRIPLERFGEVNEVIDAIIFLLGNKSSFINGQSLLLEGGYSVS